MLQEIPNPSQIIRRLERIDRRKPRHDPQAVETALGLHWRPLGTRPLPVVWCGSLAEAEELVGVVDEDASPAWDAFENRVSDGDPGLWPRPDYDGPKSEPGKGRSPFHRAWEAAWMPEESWLWQNHSMSWAEHLFKAPVPTRSAGLVAALAASPAQEAQDELPSLLAMLEAAEAGLWMFWVRKQDIVALLRPAIHFVGRLHRDGGPAVEWPDGSQLHFWNGVQVPRHVVERPEKITVLELVEHRSLEMRQILLERYGPARFLEDVGARIAHEDPCGTLYKIELPHAEPRAVLNSPTEPDSFRWVPAEMRTAREAAAWRYVRKSSDGTKGDP